MFEVAMPVSVESNWPCQWIALNTARYRKVHKVPQGRHKVPQGRNKVPQGRHKVPQGR